MEGCCHLRHRHHRIGSQTLVGRSNSQLEDSRPPSHVTKVEQPNYPLGYRRIDHHVVGVDVAVYSLLGKTSAQRGESAFKTGEHR